TNCVILAVRTGWAETNTVPRSVMSPVGRRFPSGWDTITRFPWPGCEAVSAHLELWELADRARPASGGHSHPPRNGAMTGHAGRAGSAARPASVSPGQIDHLLPRHEECQRRTRPGE